jgi:Tat protein secretion system quality control protein TatD with DNase activity
MNSYFDTHCHLNFSRFKKNLDEVVQNATKAGVESIVIPGTDIKTSQKAVEIAQKYAQNGRDIWAAVGIHPHHVFEKKDDSHELDDLEKLLKEDRVVAIGEIGLDRHEYEQTKYEDYHVDETFIEAQKQLFSKFGSLNHDVRKMSSGLGLYVVKGIIEAHGGKVSVVTSENRGYKVAITLPFTSMPASLVGSHTPAPMLPPQPTVQTA